jgi:radical SAM protein with 4Fe4S-binding SPASM domain
MEDNRPPARDEAFYEVLFGCQKEFGYGFHPMVYSEGIEKWKDNFLWFIKKMDEYKISHDKLYLLEVRNAEWSENEARQFGKFCNFLVRWLYDYNPDSFIYSIWDPRKNFNIPTLIMGQVGRGMPCSVQSIFAVRAGDLTVFPCHRLLYKGMALHKLSTDGQSITGVENINFPLYIASKFANRMNFPYCASCINKHFCTSGCYGSQLETTGDMFTPIPTVCRLMFIKTAEILLAFQELGVWNKIKERLTEEKIFAAKEILWKIKN